MKPATATAMAACLEQLATALREEATEQPQAQRRKLSIVAKDKGIAASTLRELIARKQITAVRFGNRRGVWLVDPAEVEAYFTRNTSLARGSRLVAAATT